MKVHSDFSVSVGSCFVWNCYDDVDDVKFLPSPPNLKVLFCKLTSLSLGISRLSSDLHAITSNFNFLNFRNTYSLNYMQQTVPKMISQLRDCLALSCSYISFMMHWTAPT